MTWNANVLRQLQENPPDLVIISMSRWIFTVNTAEENVTTETNALIRMIQKIPASSHGRDHPGPAAADQRERARVPVGLPVRLPQVRVHAHGWASGRPWARAR